ncbi:hypothetical protein GQ597_02310 [Gilliamella sp. Pra-s65]|uniref:hypothetical protein n=1 Tax=unclassified Gilliamella TaxID=2685620 RepID=UPI001320D805|nr:MULTISPECIES: hypothetical protein [unclassified Gilliamella]MWN32761.1 hypothetical protein [Gilliamella sp. Pra-s60]MWN89547.1 hypothetical protein [Gilliamella sp. Pra-s65]MWP30205.1 hypothetical protein [Gilliamella sp. Pra-s54]MWP47606.1 hypothetical protein [Gilliamella sp. Pas-s27]MWP72555.1 hypothetical protein [Gilliamella sp. Pra-s52]
MRYLFLCIGLLFFVCFDLKADKPLERDPFQPYYSISCSEQTEQLLEQIQIWHFRGIMKQIDQNYQQIWLVSDNQWLAITDDAVPNVLFPWHVQSLLNDKIIWQANLPDYCHNTVSWTMPINE